MTCPRCQHENPATVKFCGECGARLDVVCSACRAPNPPANKFCHECGAPMGVKAPAAAHTSPEFYTPKHLAEKILTSKAALEGERKQVTVLFADLKGSMELLADRDPEDARKLLDPVLERMMEAVHQFEGTVNQVMGDGIMALFGAPVAHEDHAVRACYAALRMQESLKRYADDARRAHGMEVQIRVGLNSGEVVVRTVGSDLRMDYTAVGQTTHLASRMEQLAPPGTVRLTAETMRLAEGYVEVRSLGPIPVKGLPAPIEIFELMGAGQARTRLEAAALRGLTRFVGRDGEVEHLRRVLGQAGACHGQVVAIVGEAGVGKSRLTYEFTHSHRVQDWLILEAVSVSYGKATSYLPVIDLLKGYFKILDRDDHREMRAKVLGRVLGLDRALEPLLPPLLALLDVPVEDTNWQTLDPPERRQRTLNAIKRLLLRESQVQPLLVVFEDLHWIDGETQALLDSLVESLGSARLLLLVNYRPEYQHAWGSKRSYSQVRLEALPADSARELLEALLGDDPGLVPLKHLLVTRANPFFLEETVRTLVETQALAGQRGRYRLTQPVQAIQVPPTVQVLLAARIDRLAPEDKRLLQTASVVGKDVPLTLLQAIAELPDEALRRGLDHLQAAEFLYETKLFPELEYTFAHALTHEVVYGSLLRDRRRSLHQRLVDVVEAMYGDRAVDYAERLAHHALGAESWERAIGYLRLAAKKDVARSASQEARVHLEQALAALSRMPASDSGRVLAVDLRIDMQAALQPLGHGKAMLRYLREAQAVAEALGDQLRLGRVSAHIAYCLWWVGEPDSAVDAGRRALAIGTSSADVVLEVVAAFRLGMALFFTGALREAMQLFGRTVELLSGDRAEERFGLPFLPAVFSRVYLAWASAWTGEFRAASDAATDALRIAEAVDHPFTTVWAHVGVGIVRLGQGHVRAAIEALERSLVLWRHGDWAFMFPWVAAPLGRAYATAGRIDEAIELLGQSADRSSRMGVIPLLVQDLTYLSEALVASERHDAHETVDRVLTLCRLHRQRLFEADAVRIQAQSLARNPDGRRALQAQIDALSLARELGMMPLVAHGHAAVARLYRLSERPHEAQEHLRTATTMYREMGMTYWLEQVETEVKGLI